MELRRSGLFLPGGLQSPDNRYAQNTSESVEIEFEELIQIIATKKKVLSD